MRMIYYTVCVYVCGYLLSRTYFSFEGVGLYYNLLATY